MGPKGGGWAGLDGKEGGGGPGTPPEGRGAGGGLVPHPPLPVDTQLPWGILVFEGGLKKGGIETSFKNFKKIELKTKHLGFTRNNPKQIKTRESDTRLPEGYTKDHFLCIRIGRRVTGIFFIELKTRNDIFQKYLTSSFLGEKWNDGDTRKGKHETVAKLHDEMGYINSCQIKGYVRKKILSNLNQIFQQFNSE